MKFLALVVMVASLQSHACEVPPPPQWLLQFPALSPSQPGPAIAPVVNPTSPAQGGARLSSCGPGTSFTVTIKGDLRLKHVGTGVELPFTVDARRVTLNSAAQKAGVPLILEGRIEPLALRNAPAGNYVGLFTVEVSP